MNIENHLKSLLVKTCQEYNVTVPKFRLSTALKSANGTCRVWWNTRTKELTKCEIVISKHITDYYSVKTSEETLYHEIAHYLDYLYNKTIKHGDSFKKLCVALGGTMNTDLASGEYTSAASSDYVSKKMGYIYKCPCGCTEHKTIRKVATKMLDRYICPKCKTKIKYFKIEEI